MTTSVTIKTADKAAMVHSSSSTTNEDGSYHSYTSIIQKVAPNSELTVHIYGLGNVSVNEVDEVSDELKDF